MHCSRAPASALSPCSPRTWTARSSFYQDVFGLPVFFEDEHPAVFRFDNTVINLLKIALRDKDKELLASKVSRERDWTAAAAGRLSLAGEFGRLNAELERLRAILREHGIEPGGNAA